VSVLWDLDSPRVEGVFGLDKQRDGELCRPDFDLEDLVRAELGVCKCAKAVDGLGREYDDPAVTKDRGGEIYHFC